MEAALRQLGGGPERRDEPRRSAWPRVRGRWRLARLFLAFLLQPRWRPGACGVGGSEATPPSRLRRVTRGGADGSGISSSPPDPAWDGSYSEALVLNMGMENNEEKVLLRSSHQGCKVDAWSAGVILLYLITGKTPFGGDPEQNMR